MTKIQNFKFNMAERSHIGKRRFCP